MPDAPAQHQAFFFKIFIRLLFGVEIWTVNNLFNSGICCRNLDNEQLERRFEALGIWIHRRMGRIIWNQMQGSGKGRK